MWKPFIVSLFFARVLSYANNFIVDANRFKFDQFVTNEQIGSYEISSATTCEVPEVNEQMEKNCNFRNSFFRENAFTWWSGFGCFTFTQPSLVNNSARPLVLNTCQYKGENVRCMVLATPSGALGCYPFDRRFTQVEEALMEQFTSSVGMDKWRRCSAAAQECCKTHGDNSFHNDSRSCPATWDAWTCWASADADSVQRNVCPEFAYSNSGPTCHHFNSKICYSNGSWEATTDYSTCSITPRLIRRIHLHIGCLSASLAVSLPAIFIFFFYRRLRITRVALHRNLLIAIVCRNILVIISRKLLYLDELTSTSGATSMARNEWQCKMLTILEKIASNTIFVCMLVDGIYLHRLIAAVFKQEINIKILYGVGAIIAITPVIIWSSLMATMNNTNCWLVYDVNGIQWVLDAPRIAILLINTILLADILRVLLTKLRRKEDSSQLSTTRATLFLMPLFGSQFLLTAWRPNTVNCAWEQAFYVITYAMEGLQGFTVSILYCYWNKEVRGLIKATYEKTENVIRKSGNNMVSRFSVTITGRRSTFTTVIENNDNSTNPHSNKDLPTYEENAVNEDDFGFSPKESDLPRGNEVKIPNRNSFAGFINLNYIGDSNDHGNENDINKRKISSTIFRN